jgi:hypothetical protein
MADVGLLIVPGQMPEVAEDGVLLGHDGRLIVGNSHGRLCLAHHRFGLRLGLRERLLPRRWRRNPEPDAQPAGGQHPDVFGPPPFVHRIQVLVQFRIGVRVDQHANFQASHGLSAPRRS